MIRKGVGLVIVCLAAVAAQADLKKNTVEAFEHYTTLTEARIQKEQSPGGLFLALDGLNPSEKAAVIQRLKNGEVVIDRVRTLDNGKEIETPNGMIHHWRAVVFVPGANIKQALDLVQNYDHHNRIYAPDVERSRLVNRQGDKFSIYYRVRRKKVITVVMDMYYDVSYAPIVGTRTTSRSYSTRIQEVKDPGESQEDILPADTGTGFMWRLYTYWRFEERDGGLYIQCEAISLSRDIPTAVRWMVGPFVESVPRESLIFTLGRTREQLTRPIQSAMPTQSASKSAR